MKPTRVLRVPSLSAFVQEIPPVNGRPAVVRLNAVESFLPNGKTAIPRKSVGLSLQGVNAQGELVWLYGVAYRVIGHQRRSSARRRRLDERLRWIVAPTASAADDSIVDSDLWDSPRPITNRRCSRPGSTSTGMPSWVTIATRRLRSGSRPASSWRVPTPTSTGYERSSSSTSTVITIVGSRDLPRPLPPR